MSLHVFPALRSQSDYERIKARDDRDAAFIRMAFLIGSWLAAFLIAGFVLVLMALL